MDTITWPLPKNVRFYRMIIISCMTLPNIAKLTAYKSTKKWWPSYSLHKKASENGAHIFMGRTAFASNNSIKRRGSSWLAWCILKVGPPAEPIMVSVNRACRLAITDSASILEPHHFVMSLQIIWISAVHPYKWTDILVSMPYYKGKRLANPALSLGYEWVIISHKPHN